MHDVELYRYLLGLESPWKVERVKLDIQEQRVDVWAGHPKRQKWACPECGTELALYDHTDERAWRHLDSCQFKTYLHVNPPRVQCSEHGVKQVTLPWAEPHARFTALFERLAIDVLRETDIQGATRILRISWDEAWHIIERAVRRGQRRKKKRNIKYLGVDETAARKGAKYLTLVCDLKRSSVEHVAEDRQIGSLGGYLEGLSRRQIQAIEAIAMDMWNPYEQAVLAHVPNGAEKIVFDKFHIVRHMNRAVDMVRKREHRKLRSEGDETLKGSKYLWLWGQENVPEKHRERFEDLKTMHLKTGRAWAIKEALRQLWNYTTRGWAMRFWNKWYWWATHSRLKPVIEVARMIKRRLRNVMTYFRHPITSATSESINSNVQAVKRMARGFRNLDHFKTAIFFHCGKLDLYPVTHTIPG